MAKKFYFLIVALALMALGSINSWAQSPTVRFFKETAGGSANGEDWNNAYGKDALYTQLVNAAKPENSGTNYVFFVAKGTYKPADTDRGNTFTIGNNVKIYGGFAGGENVAEGNLATALADRDFATNATTLSGDINADVVQANDCYHVVTVPAGATVATVIDGFTITGGNANYTSEEDHKDQRGGGLYNEGAPVISNCIFKVNYGLNGGGMYNLGNAAITNCTFSENEANWGAGLYNNKDTAECSPNISNCTFASNNASEQGGGMYNLGVCTVTVTNCTFSANQAGGGANAGGGVYNSGDGSQHVAFTNCTFSGNQATAGTGGGMYIGAYGTAAVTNCIFWGNTASSNPQLNVGANATITYCVIQGGDAATFNGAGNIFDDPKLQSLAANDGTTHTCALGVSSSAIGAGTTTGAPETDQRGVVRNAGSNGVDIGAYQDNGTRYAITVTTGANGKISPSGTVYVKSGENKIFTITPNADFVVDDFTVNGSSKKGEIADGKYTHTATAEVPIAATFKAGINIGVDNITTMEPTGGTLTYNKTAKTLAFNIKYNGGTTLTKGTDYTVIEGTDKGTNAGQYNLTITGKGDYIGSKTFTWTIGPKEITAVTGITAENKNYDGNTTATLNTTGASFTGIEGGDNLTVATATGTFAVTGSEEAKGVYISGGNVTAKTVNITDITLGGADAGNYTLTTATASTTAKITAKALTVTANAKTITYGDAPANAGVTYSGFAGEENEDVVTGNVTYNYNYAQFGDVAGGSYTITPVVAGLTATNYSFSAVAGTLTVKPLPVTLTWSPEGPYVYTGSPITVTAEVSNKVNGDVVDVATYTGNTETNVGGPYTAKATALDGANAGNYTLTEGTDVEYPWSISLTPCTITLTANQSKDYNGLNTQEPTVETSTGTNGAYTYLWYATSEDATSGENVLEAAPSKAGEYYVRATNNGNGITHGRGISDFVKYTINKVALTVTAKDKTITYGAAPTNDGVTYSGWVNGESSGVLTGTLAYDYSYTRYGDIGNTYTITPSGLTADNYDIAYATGTLTVEALQLTIDAPTASDGGFTKVYDGTLDFPTASIVLGAVTGIYDSEVTVGITSAVFGSKDVASNKTVTVAYEFTNTTGKETNYIVPVNSTVSGASITTREIVVTPDAGQSKIVGESDPAALTYTVTDGQLAGETPNFIGNLQRAEGSAVGDYAISNKNLALADNESFKAANYSLTVVGGVKFTITAKSIADVTVANIVADYDYTGSAIQPVPTVKDGGSDLLEGTDYTLSYGDNINVAEGGSVTITGKGNYAGSSKTVTFSIAKKALTVTAKAHTITYGDEVNTNSGVTYTGLVATDDAGSGTPKASVLTGTLAYTCTYDGVANFNGNSYTIKPIGLEAANYEITYETGVLTVNPKQVTLTWSGGPVFKYDGESKTVTATIVGVMNNDVVTLDYINASKQDAGNYKATATLNSANPKANCYTLSDAGYDWSISNVVVEFDGDVNNIVYDKTAKKPAVKVTKNGTPVTAETNNYTVAYNNNTDAGEASVTVTFTAGGTCADELAQTLNFTIKQKPVELGWDYTDAIPYDGDSKTVAATVNNNESGDVVTVVYSTGSQTSATNAGTYTATVEALNGAAATNYTTVGGTNLSQTWKINKATIPSVTFANSTVTYDKEQHSLVVGNLPPYVTAGDVSYTYQKGSEDATATAPTDAGEYTVTATIAGTDNYNGWTDTKTLTISKKEVTVSGITAEDKEYDGETTADLVTSGATFTGKIGTDELTVSATGNFNDKSVADDKTVTISGLVLGGASAANYELAGSGHQPTANADITARVLTISGITAANKEYDGSTNATLSGVATATLTGKVVGENVSLKESVITGKFGNKHVGTAKPITVSGVELDGTDKDNYTVSNTLSGVTANITAADLVISIENVTKTYDGTNTVSSATPTPVRGTSLKGTDSFTGGTFAFTNANVGTGNKEVTVADVTVDDGNGGANYNVSYESNTSSTITAKSIAGVSVTGIADAYDYTGSAIQPMPVVKDGGTDLAEGVDYTLSYGTNKDAGTDAGSVTITGNGNYNGTKDVTFTINKIDIPGLTFAGNTVPCDGEQHPLAIVGDIPEGLIVSYDNNDQTDPGVHTVTANIAGGTNYNDWTADAMLTINPYIAVTYTSTEGTLTPAPVDSKIVVPYGTDQIIAINPVAGKGISTVIAGSTDVTDAVSAANNTYTFNNVQTNQTFAVTFEPVTTHAITASAGPGGTITPIGVINVKNGTSRSFAFVANADYAVDKVLVDGVEDANATSPYTFTGVTADASIAVSFKLTATPSVTSAVTYAYGDVATPLAATCTNEAYTLQWYTAASGGTASTTAPTPDTHVTAGTTTSYWVSQKDANGLESSRVKIDVTVTKADITGITFVNGSFPYDGTAKSLAITGTLPTGASVGYADNSLITVGSQTATATINGGDNYNSTSMNATLAVTQATLEFTLSDLTVSYDGQPHALVATGVPSYVPSVSYSYADAGGGTSSNAPSEIGVYTVTATVAGTTNYTGWSKTATLTISAVTNQAPIASITPLTAYVVNEGETASLDASNSYDPDGDALHYTWTAPAGVTIVDGSTATPTFTAPFVTADTEITVSLVVSDGELSSEAANVVFTVKNVNAAPVANAGEAQTVNEGAVVTLLGSATDAENDTVTFAWTAPEGITLSANDVATPTFTAPKVEEQTEYTFSLIASDGKEQSEPATVVVTVKAISTAPIANAGEAQTVKELDLVTLDASASKVKEGATITYAWTAPTGVVLSDATVVKPTFTAPEVDADTEYTFTLKVSDGKVQSEADTVKVMVKNVPATLVLSATFEGKALAANQVSYVLYKKTPAAYVASSAQATVNGNETTFALEDGEWIVLASPVQGGPNFVPTYTGGTDNWSNASLVIVPKRGSVSASITCIAPPVAVEGTGVIAGYIFESITTQEKSISVVKGMTGNEPPVPGALVLLFTKGETKPVASCLTDAKGYFKFEKLAMAEYEMSVEIPGYTQYVKLPVALTETAPENTAFFAVNTTTQVITDAPDALEVKFSVWPNPVVNELNISLSNIDNSPISMELYSINGALVSKHLLDGPETTIDMSGYTPGTYVLRVVQGQKVWTKKLIKK